MHLIDMIRLDHHLLLSEIDDFQHCTKITSLNINIFLNNILNHTIAEHQFLQREFDKSEEFHFYFLEDQIEHEIILSTVIKLKRKIRFKEFPYEDEILQICQMLEQHIMQEENDLLPQIKRIIKEEQSISLGKKYYRFRKFKRSQTLLLTHLNHSFKFQNNYFTSADKFF